jgi:hypothetical protein
VANVPSGVSPHKKRKKKEEEEEEENHPENRSLISDKMRFFSSTQHPDWMCGPGSPPAVTDYCNYIW